MFGVYGIDVNARHLSLIADYMTRTGSYKAMNRLGMNECASPFLQMSFETTSTFLTKAAAEGTFCPCISSSFCPYIFFAFIILWSSSFFCSFFYSFFYFVYNLAIIHHPYNLIHLPFSFLPLFTFFCFLCVGAVDSQQSPSARIVLGSVARVGTGCFDIMLPLITA